MTNVTSHSRQHGPIIRDLRRQRGIKVAQLAGQVGVDRTHIYNIENGVRSGSIELLYRIADALEVPIGRILADREAAS